MQALLYLKQNEVGILTEMLTLPIAVLSILSTTVLYSSSYYTVVVFSW